MYSKSLNKKGVSATKPIADISPLTKGALIIAARPAKITTSKSLALDFLKAGVAFKADAIKMLKLLQNNIFKEIDKDRPDIDRHIIDLALEHEIPEVLEALFETIRAGNRLAVIGGKENDYHALKQFIKRSLQLDYSKYQANSETKSSILKQLIEIDPRLIEIINEEINRVSSLIEVDSRTLHAFKNDFGTLCNQYAQSSLPFMAFQSEKNSNFFLSKLPQAHTKAPSS